MKPATAGSPIRFEPKHIEDTDFRITIGGKACGKPYSASIYNISAMSFGSLSGNAISALNKGAALGGFAHDTGEGGISRYHREGGGDLIYEIGSGYFGCRADDGGFSPEKFAEQAARDQIKMIELKLSQGAKPGHGGMLPAAKITREISDARGVPMGQDCVSPASHSAFSTPIEMMQFLGRLRELSGGKPVGFKLCIGHQREFMCMVKAMLETGIIPDFIVVDGTEGGTGAAPLEFANHVGMPMVGGIELRAQHPARCGHPRSGPDRCGGQDRLRVRHRPRAGAGCGLVQLRTRLHVLHRLHPGPGLPYQPLPGRRRHAGSAARPRPRPGA